MPRAENSRQRRSLPGLETPQAIGPAQTVHTVGVVRGLRRIAFFLALGAVVAALVAACAAVGSRPPAEIGGPSLAPAASDLTFPVVLLEFGPEDAPEHAPGDAPGDAEKLHFHSGETVEIRVDCVGENIDALRLAIDGADTGWRKRASLDEGHLRFEWIAGEPGDYEIVGQARDDSGNIGEERRVLTVVPVAAHEHPHAETPAPATPDLPTAEPPTPESVVTAALAPLTVPTTEPSVMPTAGPPTEPTLVPTSTPAPILAATFTERTITLPTYPYDRYQTDAINPVYRWPIKRFDRDRFLLEAPTPEPRAYRLLVVENSYLRLLILPELGGRIWQVIHKPSGDGMFYQNRVVKPSPWGPPEQLGWFGLGGLEWALPVIEHGYDWGTEWLVQPLQHIDKTGDEAGAKSVRVVISTPDDGRLLAATIRITLPSDAAAFIVEPEITNVSDRRLEFSFWETAMLAPGPANQPSKDLRFVLPTKVVTVHSTGDLTLPAPGMQFAWPEVQGRDMSRLGAWNQYLGLFEYPAAHGPFVGVYDEAYDAGAVRVYPAQTARGSKVFSLGFNDALTSEYFTDDGSTYVELHGGLAPTFFDLVALEPGESVSWRESWYPVHGIGGLSAANDDVAIYAQARRGDLQRGVSDSVDVGVYPTRALIGEVVALVGGEIVARAALQAAPDVPYTGRLRYDTTSAASEIQVRDVNGQTVIAYALP